MAAPGKVKVQQVMVIGMAVLFAVRMPILLRSLGIIGRPAAPPPVATAVSGSVQEPPRQPEAHAPKLPDGATPVVSVVKYTAETARDPLMSLLPKEQTGQARTATPTGSGSSAPVAPPQPPPVTVDGIIWGGPRPQALLNGKAYELGETVQGAKIVAITRQGVTVEVAGARFLLSPSKNPRVSTYISLREMYSKTSRLHNAGTGAGGATGLPGGEGDARAQLVLATREPAMELRELQQEVDDDP